MFFDVKRFLGYSGHYLKKDNKARHFSATLKKLKISTEHSVLLISRSRDSALLQTSTAWTAAFCDSAHHLQEYSGEVT
jgi:hypothetical protein